MATFIAGLAILLVGGALYGRLCERAFGPDDRTTPAIEKADGVDYVPMPKWRYSGWANQTLGVCALVTVTIWLISHGKRRVAWMPLVPLAFYAFITCTFLLSARIGFNLPIQVAYAVGAIFAIAACALSLWWGSRRRE